MDIHIYAIAFMILSMINSGSSDQRLNLLNFGAVGDGVTDDSNAFTNAWVEACGSTTYSIIDVPKGKRFLVKPLTFVGPCNASQIAFMISGNIIAPNREIWGQNVPLLRFCYVNELSLTGTGIIDGQGATWWTTYDGERPRIVQMHSCNNLRIEGLNLIDSPESFVTIDDSINATISNIHITAPSDSPNTDGFDISASSHINILNSTIQTGDDCVALNSGSSDITITGVYCGPGHGISIGSLGKDGEIAAVDGVYVGNCTFQNTYNGARIKTYQGGKGYARNIKFEQIILINVRYPIIIDQYYCPERTCGQGEGSAVQISNVTFNGFTGTSADQMAIQLNCSASVGCTEITVENISIDLATPKGIAIAACTNAHGRASNTRPSIPCLLP